MADIPIRGESEKNTTTLKELALDDQPRFKLKAKGPASLSNSELLALLIGSGSPQETAVQLCQRILSSVANNLDRLALLSLRDLMAFKGIGEAKAILISAALELSRRRQIQHSTKRLQVLSSKAAYEAIAPVLIDKSHEEFWVLYLSQSGHQLACECLSQGGVSATVVDPRLIFKRALELLASKLVLIHNHPSGHLKPSKHDLNLTKKLCDGARLMEMRVVDHLIVHQRDYFSFADEDLMPIGAN